MPIRIPLCPERPSIAPAASRKFEIKLITPMFGGGVETRVNDPSFPIRPTTIRGHLQFWWRATVGAQYPTLETLRSKQTEIWGSTERASQVQVLVENVQASEPEACAQIEWAQHARGGQGGGRTGRQRPFDGNDSALSYVLFPFQGKTAPPEKSAKVTVPPAACICQASFQLTLLCPDHLWPQVEPALWAWLNFGGLGSRTRRGCGAISCRALAPKDRDELIKRLKLLLKESFPIREWPTLAAGILVGSERPNAQSAWVEVIARFRDFRQGVNLGRNPGQQPGRPGRSRFPEPETIRRVKKQRSGQHTQLPHIPDDAFPRAEFGLPLVFHFKDAQRGDPSDTVLYPSNDSDGEPRYRMASPLILKPLALANDKFVPLILRLKAPELAEVDLREKKSGQEHSLPLPNPTYIRGAALAKYKNSPLEKSPNGSALEAFCAYARTQGFAEVSQ